MNQRELSLEAKSLSHEDLGVQTTCLHPKYTYQTIKTSVMSSPPLK